MDNKLILGKQGTDLITGFSGCITGIAEYLTGCRQFLLMPHGPDSTDLKSGHWFDESRITIGERHLNYSKIFKHENGADLQAPVK